MRVISPPRVFTIGPLVVLVLALWHTLARAQAADPYQFSTLDCLFTKNIVTSLESKRFKSKSGTDNFPITFSGFDAKKGEAMLIGNAGSDKVFYFPGDRKIMLVQITDAGNGSMTSISDPVSGRSVAFHSRHMWLAGQPVVSHYYEGSCRKR